MGLGRRVLLALVGVVVLLAYVAAAAVVAAGVLALLSLDVPLPTALAVAAVVTLTVGYLSYRTGTARILAQLDAVPVAPQRAPTAYRTLETLADRMDVDPPTLYVARMAAPNAISLGGPGGAVVFDRTLFRILDRDEFAAVLAHELAHIEHRDSLVQSLAYTVGRTLVGFLVVLVLPVALLARGVSRLLAWAHGRPGERRGLAVHERVGRVVLVALVLVTMVVRARSRQREFAADDRAVEVTGDPVALASALRKIDRASKPRGLLGHLYRRGRQDDVPPWLSTHPALEDRIQR
ncbi:MAG: M48 family metallopeptidase, partial [Halobacterium sp.]